MTNQTPPVSVEEETERDFDDATRQLYALSIDPDLLPREPLFTRSRGVRAMSPKLSPSFAAWLKAEIAKAWALPPIKVRGPQDGEGLPQRRDSERSAQTVPSPWRMTEQDQPAPTAPTVTRAEFESLRAEIAEMKKRAARDGHSL
jgi:hypothetical protein